MKIWEENNPVKRRNKSELQSIYSYILGQEYKDMECVLKYIQKMDWAEMFYLAIWLGYYDFMTTQLKIH